MPRPIEEEFEPDVPRWALTPSSDTYQDQAERWLRSSALQAVRSAFSEQGLHATEPRLSEDEDTAPFAVAMAAWSSKVLDTRQGRERQAAPPVTFSEYQQRVLLRAARPLGLEASRQPTTTPSRIVVLGGTVTANHLRIGLAAKLVEAGIATDIVLVGAARPLQPWEAQVAMRSSPPQPVADELAHLRWVSQQVFGGAPYSSPSPTTGHFRHAPPVSLLEARRERPGLRPNTLDCYRAVRHLGHSPSTILVTSAIYQPYTFFLLAPHMPRSDHTEVIGTRSQMGSDSALKAQRIGQEIHAGIQAAAAAWLRPQ